MDQARLLLGDHDERPGAAADDVENRAGDVVGAVGVGEVARGLAQLALGFVPVCEGVLGVMVRGLLRGEWLTLRAVCAAQAPPMG